MSVANWRITIDRLDTLRLQWWLFSLLCGIVAAASLSLLFLIAIVLLDVAVELPARGQVTMFVMWCAAAMGSLAWAVLRSFRGQRSREAAARCVEVAYPEIGNDLINVVQLAESDGGGSNSFRQAALAEASLRTTFTSIERTAHRHTRRSRWRLALHTPRDLLEACAALLTAVGLFCLLGTLIPNWWSSVDRILIP